MWHCLLVAAQLRSTQTWHHVCALPLPSYMISTVLSLGLLIHKMGIEQLSGLCVGRPHPGEGLCTGLGVDSAVSQEETRRQHRPEVQQAGKLGRGDCVTGVGWLPGARKLILLV